jgi:hypothetical protein
VYDSTSYSYRAKAKKSKVNAKQKVVQNSLVQGQLLSLIVDALNPIYEAFSDPNGRFQTPPPSHFQGQFPGIDPGTQFPQATGRDELFPADCGRHTHDGTGKMCFPDGILCQNSKLIF